MTKQQKKCFSPSTGESQISDSDSQEERHHFCPHVRGGAHYKIGERNQMAWTVSAATRSDFADAQAETAAWSQATAFIVMLGSGEFHRGLCILFAAFLTCAGTAAAHLPPIAMATFLFVTGAVLALAAFPLRHHASDATKAPTWHTHATKQFEELAEPRPQRAAVDRDHWSTLTAHMSHELRTPLNAVIGFSELMAQEAFGPHGCSQYGAYAKDIHASGKSLLKAAEDALAITAILATKGTPSQQSAISLSSLVREACEYWNSDLSKTAVTFKMDVAESCEIVADPQSVRQMIINLLYDAQQRSTALSHLTIAVSTEDNEVSLNLLLAPSTDHEAPPTSSFGLKMASTLAELIGAKLACGVCSSGAWQANVRFARNSQADFFA